MENEQENLVIEEAVNATEIGNFHILHYTSIEEQR